MNQKFEWKPIETAPKDGTRILAYTNGAYAVALWSGNYWATVPIVSKMEIVASHWMPLPFPPEVTS